MCPVEEIAFEEVLEDPFKIKMLSAGQIERMQRELKTLLEKENALVRLQEPRPAVVIGDTHGDLRTVISILSKEFLPPEDKPYLILLGDYVDRGPNQVATLNLISMLKVHFPDRVVMLRGNHESEEMNNIYGFRRAASDHPCIGESGFKRYQDVFGAMPHCVLLEWNRVFGVHGGTPFDPHHEGPFSLGELKALKKAKRLEDLEEASRQMMWGDPSEDMRAEEGYEFNFKRGFGYLFGRRIFDEFMDGNDISLAIRSHQMFQEGYWYFFDNRLLSIFSTRHYDGYSIEPHYAKVDVDGGLQLLEV
ncbi:MAG: metallophosphoesterase [Candidatus Thermoplasmatota archaeon]|nr:metallophosphoesterase [Candidatus Thermoplasmatota archaeon]